MYKVAVCDDNEKIRELVCQYIDSYEERIETKSFSSGEELLENYDFFDAVFLDIDMGGMDGIETARRIRRIDKNIRIVYLTAYRDYVRGAFEVHAFQYLLKPVRPEAIRNILGELFRYAQKPSPKETVSFQTPGGLLCLDPGEICYFEYSSRKVRIVTTGENHLMTEKIGAVAEKMERFGFSMPHQSFVVNMLHVKNVRGQEILMDNGDRLPLSQKKTKIWKMQLADYLSHRLERRREDR